MESLSVSGPSPNLNPTLARALLPSPKPSSFSLSSRFDPWRWRSPSSLKIHRPRSLAVAALRRSEHDVVVVGAGIIGLAIARELLLRSDLSVAIVDAALPCSGATGAGQGYIWMAHRTPGNDTWELAVRSKQLWEDLAESISSQGMDPSELLGWKRTGSLLIGRSSEELVMLEERVNHLSQAGTRADFLSASSLCSKEPALEVGKEGAAAFFPDDCQLDAYQTVAFIEKGNKSFASQGRYAEFYNDPAVGLLGSEKNGMSVQTSKNILLGKKAVVIAAGAWSGKLMQSLATESTILPYLPVKPRKGHLLVLENFKQIHLNHGLMEVGYVDHQVAASSTTISGLMENEDDLSSISMTATIDVKGNLVLGSSRQFVGFSREVDESIIKSIWDRAGEFFPALKALSLEYIQNTQIRIGHRPYLLDGKPVIGPVPGLPNILLATGHEGSGLCLALGTAEMVADMILGNAGKVDSAPFSIQGRF